MIELKAKFLKVGSEFTTTEDQGEVWFKVIKVDQPAGPGQPLTVHSEVVACNPGVDYAVGDRDWGHLGPDQLVIVR